MLTTKKIDAAKPAAKQYKMADADGLYLVVTPRNVKSWRCNFKQNGKHQTKTFGQYPEVGLAKARLLNVEFKEELAKGPVSSVPTFDKMKADWYKHKLPGLKNLKHQLSIQNRLDNYVSPKIGTTRLDEIKRVELVGIVKEVEQRGTVETAHRVSMHIRQVLDYAVDLGIIEHHPAAGLSRVLKAPKVKHMASIKPEDAGKLFKDIMEYDEPVTRSGLMLLASTFVRTNELRWMVWEELMPEPIWVIPGERMKLNLPHVVPLSRLSLDILDELRMYTGDLKYVLQSPARPNHPISENTLLFALYRMGYKGKMTGHGFRSLASTVMNQESDFSKDVIERQLAHKETDDVRAAYNRAEYLQERIKLMDWWGDWICTQLQSQGTSAG